jgi:hypothetical protein
LDHWFFIFEMKCRVWDRATHDERNGQRKPFQENRWTPVLLS